MTAIRKVRKTKDDMTLIDIKKCGVSDIKAIFLIKSEKICLINEELILKL